MAGVCGGIAEYLNIDPLVVRLIFVALLLFGIAPIILIYLIMWVVVPDNPAEIKSA
ncbi:MAG TPA: PspC domain-containing protein [Verrucomicrobiae bacterium]|nr:PspC domain-containing protein [Verrucomicrobiae bacterium]